MNRRIRTFLCSTLAVVAGLAVAVSLSQANDDGDPSERNDGVDLVDDLLRAWDRSIDAPRRFVVLKSLRREAVLDRETQLVWQRAPKDEPDRSTFRTSFFGAVRHCFTVTTGGRMGWRVPTAEELTSLLVETPTANGVLRATLPSGHPFMGVLAERYWTISEGSSQGQPGRHAVAPNQVEISTVALETDLNNIHPTWCVRGPGGGQSTRIP